MEYVSSINKINDDYLALCCDLAKEILPPNYVAKTRFYNTATIISILSHYDSKPFIIKNKSLLEYKLDIVFNQIIEFWKSRYSEMINAIKLSDINGIWIPNGLSYDITNKLLLYYDCVFVPESFVFCYKNWYSYNLDQKLFAFLPILCVLDNKMLMMAKTNMPLLVYYPEGHLEQDSELYQTIKNTSQSQATAQLMMILGEKVPENILNTPLLSSSYRYNYLLKEVNKNMNVSLLVSYFNYLDSPHSPALGISKEVRHPQVKIKELVMRINKRELTGNDLLFILDEVENDLFTLNSYDAEVASLFIDICYDDFLEIIRKSRNALIAGTLDKSLYNEGQIIDFTFRNKMNSWDNLVLGDLIRLREGGFWESFRDGIRIQSKLLREAKVKDFSLVCDDYRNQIMEYMKQEEEKLLKDKEKIKKSFGLSLLSCVATFSLTGASFIFPVANIIGAVVGITYGTDSIHNTIARGKEYFAFKDSLNCRPTTILIEKEH